VQLGRLRIDRQNFARKFDLIRIALIFSVSVRVRPQRIRGRIEPFVKDQQELAVKIVHRRTRTRLCRLTYWNPTRCAGRFLKRCD
jgi:hypothetical protein